MAVVTQQSTPGQSALPATTEELKSILDSGARYKVITVEGIDATVEKVLSTMDECSWVHMACHGVQDSAEPTSSGLLLHNGRLELRTIVQKSLSKADFAFLSACQTATGDQKQSDEAIYLAAGMLLAGYRGVIATMWSIGDQYAPLVADDVYSELLANGPDSSVAAGALQRAVGRLRERYGGRSYALWLPYIHVGV